MAEKEQQKTLYRLAEVFAPCFSLILQLRESTSLTDAESLRQNALNVIGECEQRARMSASSEDVSDAKFAIVAFIDETILSSSSPAKTKWMARPLQLQLYDRFDAGEHFFERLERLQSTPSSNPAVLEVYYLCMTLGFKGQYQLVEQDKLRAHIEAARTALTGEPQLRPGSLSPNGEPRDQVAAEVKSKLPTWAIIAAAATIGLLIYVGMTVFVTRKANDVEEEIRDELIVSVSVSETAAWITPHPVYST